MCANCLNKWFGILRFNVTLINLFGGVGAFQVSSGSLSFLVFLSFVFPTCTSWFKFYSHVLPAFPGFLRRFTGQNRGFPLVSHGVYRVLPGLYRVLPGLPFVFSLARAFDRVDRVVEPSRRCCHCCGRCGARWRRWGWPGCLGRSSRGSFVVSLEHSKARFGTPVISRGSSREIRFLLTSKTPLLLPKEKRGGGLAEALRRPRYTDQQGTPQTNMQWGLVAGKGHGGKPKRPGNLAVGQK